MAPGSIGALARSNTTRTVHAAARDVDAARQILARPATITPRHQAVLQARVDHPCDTLGQIADRLGVTKDAYSATLRRALRAGAPTPRVPALEAVRRRYAVPAIRGRTVRYRGRYAIIRGAQGGMIVLAVTGQRSPVFNHPLYGVDYLDGRGVRIPA
jgi:hypothetical protein